MYENKIQTFVMNLSCTGSVKFSLRCSLLLLRLLLLLLPPLSLSCSPVLFSLFINDLDLDIIYNGRHGVSLSSDFVQLMILLFADDMILLSETVIGLQTQLNSLFSAASRLQLKVNMNKSNIVVFRKGGYLGARERWIYDGSMMRVVNSYKYLGICFSTRLRFYHACQDLVSRAKRVLLCIMSKLYRIDCNSINVFFEDL